MSGEFRAPRSEHLAPLIGLAARGDRDAIAALLDAIFPATVLYCRARLRPYRAAAAAEREAAHRICAEAVRGLTRGGDPEAGPFMITVHDIAETHLAAVRRKAPMSDDSGTDNPLNELGDTQLEILALRLFLGLTAEQAALAMSSSPGAVRIAQHRALSTLRRRRISPPEGGRLRGCTGRAS